MHVVAPIDKVAPKPPQLTFEQAAVLPYPTFVAMQALRDHGHVQPGQRVLVVGASGAVGTIAIQVAVAFGATVTVVPTPSWLSMATVPPNIEVLLPEWELQPKPFEQITPKKLRLELTKANIATQSAELSLVPDLMVPLTEAGPVKKIVDFMGR